MKRYDLVQVNACYTTDHEMEASDDGEWMRFEDHAAIVAGYEQRLALIRWWSEPSTKPDAVDPIGGSEGTTSTRDAKV